MAENLKKLYKCARWRKKRAALLKSEGLCRRCLKGDGQGRGRTFTVATVADHITPATDLKSFWKGELQPLCAKCHSQKSSIDDRLWHKKRKMFTPVTF